MVIGFDDGNSEWPSGSLLRITSLFKHALRMALRIQIALIRRQFEIRGSGGETNASSLQSPPSSQMT
jgi:hypothetical protein